MIFKVKLLNLFNFMMWMYYDDFVCLGKWMMNINRCWIVFDFEGLSVYLLGRLSSVGNKGRKEEGLVKVGKRFVNVWFSL